MRALSPTAAALFASGRYALCMLIEMQLTSTVRLATCGPSITWGGNVWQGAASIGAVEVIDHQAGEIKSLRFTLNAAPQSNLAIALSEPIRGKPVAIYTAIFDPDTYTAADVLLEEAGELDVMSIHEDELRDQGQPIGTTITATAEGAGIDLLRPRGLLYTHAHQQRLHPGDNGLEYVRDADLSIVWPDKTYRG